MILKVFRLSILRFIYLLPPTSLFGLKNILLLVCGYAIGDNVKFVSTARIFIPRLSIGDNTWIGHNVQFIGGDADVIIGKNVDVGPSVLFASGTHHFGNENRRAGTGYSKNILVGDGCWIGASATILGGVSIGSGSIVGAGSLVKDDIPSNSLVVGVPAKIVRNL